MANDITNEDIRELVQLAVDSGVAEIELQRGENRVRIRRTAEAARDVMLPSVVASVPVQHVQPAMTAPEHAGGPLAAAAHAAQGAGSAGSATPAASKDVLVESPIVGTYYDQAKPGDPPFVRVGDRVEPGQVLCIIESMKLMNEIEAEVAGTVTAKLTENGRPVEYGEALFAIRPR